MNNYFWSSSTEEGWDTALYRESVHRNTFHFAGQSKQTSRKAAYNHNPDVQPQSLCDRAKFYTGIGEVTFLPVAKHIVIKPYRSVEERQAILDITMRSFKSSTEIFYPL